MGDTTEFRLKGYKHGYNYQTVIQADSWEEAGRIVDNLKDTKITTVKLESE